VLWVPVLAVLIALNAIGDLAAAPTAWAALAAYVGILLVAGPLFRGLAYVRAALDALAEGEPALPELRTWSPTARELARAVMRLGRALRETAAGGAAARAGAEAVLAALPDPLLLIDRERRILSANPAATALLRT